MKDRRALVAALAALGVLPVTFAVADAFSGDRFRQLDELLPTPSEQRAASGAPGHRYWQQKADYVIDVELDDESQRIIGSEVVTYHNNSPDTLRYLWLQVEPNVFARDSVARKSRTAPGMEKIPYKSLARLLALEEFDGEAHVRFVKSASGGELPFTVADTVMRVDLPRPIAPGGRVTFSVGWSYPVNDAKTIRARTGYEHFEDDDNYLYEIAQWYPRVLAYTDVRGWNHKPYVGAGEFTVEFGDYLVRITAPADHIVAATGELQNADRVLSPAQRDRLRRARTAAKPIFIVTPEEAKTNEKSRSKNKKTWVFKARGVRDFAFASSRKFIWDAMGHRAEDRRVLAMSFYPKEAEPLWSRYSTQAVVHALEVYGKYTFPYPYPVAISVNGPVGGMEYPMISFNGPRPEDDGTYYGEPTGGDSWWNSKYGLIGVIIHEVGHNWFPMVVNSEERHWMWMDEGLNTFLQYLAEQEWEEDFPSWRGEPEKIVAYMTSANQVPIMTSADSVHQLGNNAYGKPATALNILRETVLGRERFDFAFKEYARRWRFKRPTPADFFRTMEDASGADLDWFWRGWFYSTDHVDIDVARVREYAVDTRDPDIEKPREKREEDARPKTLSQLRNEPLPKRVDRYPELKDFYNEHDPHAVTAQDREAFQELLKKLDDGQKALLKTDLRFYVIDFKNKGGVVMPIPLELHFTDGSVEEHLLPAELWRYNAKRAEWLLLSGKDLDYVEIDRRRQIADADEHNNRWPRKRKKSRFELFQEEAKPSPMKKQKEWREKKAQEEKEKAEEGAGSDEGSTPRAGESPEAAEGVAGGQGA